MVNPILPVAIEVGQLISARRLKTKGIVTLDPSRILISGKMRVICLDKTGTITRDDMSYLGVDFWSGR